MARTSSSLASDVGISVEDAVPVQVAATMVVQTLLQVPVSAQDFVQAGLDSSAVSEDHAAGLRRFARLVVDARPELQEQANLSRLGNTVLPTLRTFDLALDVRVQVVDSAVARSVPVVLAYVDTDSEGQVIWFQMAESAVRHLRDDLSSMLDQIETVKGSLSIGG